MIPVIYSAATGRVRRWMSDPDRKTQKDWDAAVTLGKGEAVLYTPDSVDVNALQDLVTKATGLVPANDRYAVVDGANVVGWIGNACDACGDFDLLKTDSPTVALVASDTAVAGWTLDSKTQVLVAPVEIAVAKVSADVVL